MYFYNISLLPWTRRSNVFVDASRTLFRYSLSVEIVPYLLLPWSELEQLHHQQLVYHNLLLSLTDQEAEQQALVDTVIIGQVNDTRSLLLLSGGRGSSEPA